MTVLIIYKTREFADRMTDILTRWRKDIRVHNESSSKCTISSRENTHKIVKYDAYNEGERGAKYDAIYLEDGAYEMLTQEQLMRLRMSYAIPYTYGNVKTLRELDLLNNK